jgi:hypothetical protein
MEWNPSAAYPTGPSAETRFRTRSSITFARDSLRPDTAGAPQSVTLTTGALATGGRASDTFAPREAGSGLLVRALRALNRDRRSLRFHFEHRLLGASSYA